MNVLQTLVDDLLEMGRKISDLDVTKMEDALAVMRIIQGKNTASYNRHSLSLTVKPPCKDAPLEAEWSIYDGSKHHNGATLQEAFSAYCCVKATDDKISLDMIAQQISPEAARQIKAKRAAVEQAEANAQVEEVCPI